MSEPSRQSRSTTGASMSSAAATHAKRTALRSVEIDRNTRVSAVSSSALLRHFARALWSARIPVESSQTRLGLGGECDERWSVLATLACPSDCEPVALALSIGGKGCSCSPRMPTPTATDWKGGQARPQRGRQLNLRDWWMSRYGQRYLPSAVSLAAQGFPTTWLECEPSATPCHTKSPSGSDGASSKD